MLSWTIVKQQEDIYFLEAPHILYYEFVRRTFEKYLSFVGDLEKMQSSGNPMHGVQEQYLMYEWRQCMNDILLYSALTLEAFINFYAKKYDIPYNGNLEKNLSSLNKWKVYVFMKTGKQLPGPAIEKIKRIFSIRDDIVHPKPQRIKQGQESPEKNAGIQAELEGLDIGQLVIDLNEIFKALHKVDSVEREHTENNPWMFDVIKKHNQQK